MANYDKNAWALDRHGGDANGSTTISTESTSAGSIEITSSSSGGSDGTQRLLGPIRDEDRDLAFEELVASRKYVDQLVDGAGNDRLVPLDSVGGTLLYMRASLVRQGLTFPAHNVVGTTWRREGWVGLETEGICYAASFMKGGKCFVLGGDHYVRHADWG
ncbi:hypothetical protein BX600DRAFT_444628 [Xylariales sp. PMI_506]|nr:hypothetical protein BX600DRAFT_444628 [Xylariales sp. PMI_506]